MGRMPSCAAKMASRLNGGAREDVHEYAWNAGPPSPSDKKTSMAVAAKHDCNAAQVRAAGTQVAC
eukprot:2107234-Pyramimonas_sp.AAC.1